MQLLVELELVEVSRKKIELEDIYNSFIVFVLFLSFFYFFAIHSYMFNVASWEY